MACSISNKMETHKSSSTQATIIGTTNMPTDYKLYDKWT